MGTLSGDSGSVAAANDGSAAPAGSPRVTGGESAGSIHSGGGSGPFGARIDAYCSMQRLWSSTSGAPPHTLQSSAQQSAAAAGDGATAGNLRSPRARATVAARRMAEV